MKPNPKLMAPLALMISSLVGWAQTTISSNPVDGASDVSPSASVVFTFSSAMSPSATAVFATPPTGFYPVTSAWSAGNTVLTCTPASPFPNNTAITWTVFGMDAGNNLVTGTGTFTTGMGTGGGGGGSGTNKFTTFSVGKFYFYEQNSAGASTPNPTEAYALIATTAVASNLASSASTVTLPTGGAPVSMTQNFLYHEDYGLFDGGTNQAAFEAKYPQGNYVFNVTSTPANVQGTVNQPTSMTQPNAPHVTNFAAAQAIDVTKDFTLKFDPFQGGTAADVVSVGVNDNFGKVLFATPGPGTNGALTGLATSVVIPAGKLPANSTNTAEIIFFHWVTTSNATYATAAYRATGTQLNLIDAGAGGGGTVPVVSNPVWSAGGFGFDVTTSANQSLKVLYSSDLTLPMSQWQLLTTTNSPGTSVHITVPVQAGAAGFYRLQN